MISMIGLYVSLEKGIIQDILIFLKRLAEVFSIKMCF